MLRSSLCAIALLGLTLGCGGDEEEAVPEQAAASTQTAPAQVEDVAPAPPPAAPVPQRAAQMPAMDEPWVPTDTGTVAPGMSRMDVVAVWGEPVAESVYGTRTYLYFRNGCEASCGTFDVVFLDNDQVVDAIVRGRGHSYGGVSSSPAGREAQATMPGGMGAMP